MGAVAADALFKAMCKNKKVEFLNLYNNAIYHWVSWELRFDTNANANTNS